MQDNIIVIIPAKGNSIRVPNKNTLYINGLPMFLHSCEYAKSEGFKKIVVSSDSEEILSIATANGYDTNVEVVNDSKMENCITQVLKNNPGYEILVVLQPTSPIRESGFLSDAIFELGDHKCLVSVQAIKPVAWFNGLAMYDVKNRPLDQECKNWIYHFDGSVIVRNICDYNDSGELVTIDSKLKPNKFPFYLQIDTKEEFKVIKQIIELK